MRRAIVLTATLAALGLMVRHADAGVIISPTQVNGSGGAFGSSLVFSYDGFGPPEGSSWNNLTTWWNGTSRKIVFDYGALFTIKDLLVSVDNNDTYQIQYSTDGTLFSTLTTILTGYGNVGSGMDSFSTDSTHGPTLYVAAIDFAPVNARYLSIQATAGDNSYSVGEFRASGDAIVSTVPEPGSLALLATGAVGLVGGWYRNRRKAVLAA